MGNCCKCFNKSSGENKRYTGTAYKVELKAPLLDPDLSEDTPVIVLRVLRGKGPWEDCNPYVELRVSPSEPEIGDQVQRTTNKPRNGNPCWEPPESFKFVYSDLKGRGKLVISVLDGDSALGAGFLSVKNITKERVQVVVKLSDPNSGKPGLGQIEVDVYHSTIGEVGRHDQHRCYEFQRKNILNEWGSDYPGHLLPTDPGRFCCEDGQVFKMTFAEVAPPLLDGWNVSMDWRVVATTDDPEGWQYGVDFDSVDWFSSSEAPGGGLLGRYVRRRLWQRDIVKLDSNKKRS